jgi:peptidoglycan/LPS O-acetylase OafA/YrhL
MSDRDRLSPAGTAEYAFAGIPVREYLRELDGLRAIAVIMVFFVHFGPQDVVPLVWRIKAVGWAGVDLFFVLSGFLISRILLDTRDRPDYYKSFYLRRTLRIFPLYYSVLALIFIVLLTWHHGQGYSELTAQVGNPWWSWFYLGNVQMALENKTPPNFSLVPLWSLHVEEQFYLLFPLVVRYLRMDTLRKVLLLMLVVSPLLRMMLVNAYPDDPYVEYMLLPCRLDGFAFGALIAIWLRRPQQIDRGSIAVLTAGGCLFAYAAYFFLGHDTWRDPFTRTLGYSFFSGASALVLVTTILYRGTPVTSFLNWAPIQFVGRISYAVYLLQAPVGGALAALFPALYANEILRFVLVGAGTIALAALSRRCLELPFIRMKDRFSAGTPRVAAVTSVPG